MIFKSSFLLHVLKLLEWFQVETFVGERNSKEKLSVSFGRKSFSVKSTKLRQCLKS